MAETGDDHDLDVQTAVDENDPLKEVKDCAENPMLHEEEEVIKKRYGGILPKKKPLISKDHEHAFFDSADWALGKQAQGPPHDKPKPPAEEALRPKLEPTRQQRLRSRRSAYAPPHQAHCDCDSDFDSNVDGDENHPCELQNNIPAADDDNNIHTHA